MRVRKAWKIPNLGGSGIASCSSNYRHSKSPRHWPVHGHKRMPVKKKCCKVQAENVPVEVADRENEKMALKD